MRISDWSSDVCSSDLIDALNAAAYPGGATVAEQLTQNIATIGENQSLRRSAIVTVNSGVVTGYVHNAAAPGMGKIGVLVALESPAGAAVLEPLGKQPAMHAAAATPLAPNGNDRDAAHVPRAPATAATKAPPTGHPAQTLR